MIRIFDHDILNLKHRRIASDFENHDFLFKIGFKQLQERLNFIKRDFQKILQIGSRGLHFQNADMLDSHDFFNATIIAHKEFLPFEENSYDLVISNLDLHNTNDLPGLLTQIQRILKPNGLFIASIFGGETLYELRSVFQSVELEQSGGITPRIFPFADMQQMGALMQRANFNLPVVDNEKIKVSYSHIFKLFQDLRGMGENNIIIERKKNFTSRSFFTEVQQVYQNRFSFDDKLDATFEMIFILGWKPHESQQKPLRPGSAKHRLADALNTEEGAL